MQHFIALIVVILMIFIPLWGINKLIQLLFKLKRKK